MKLRLFIITMLVSTLSWGQSIFDNPITGTNPNTSNPYTIGQNVNPNITVSGIGRGSGITGTNANNRYNANGWSTGAIDLNDYFEFTLTPNAGYKINLSGFVYNSQVSSGVANHAFRSSIDGYTTDIGSPTTTGTTTISLAAAAYQNVTTTITFRFYTFGVSAGSTTFSINDFIFNGSVSLLSQPDINVTGNFLNILSGDITPIPADFTDYGNVTVGGNLGATFTIENLGPATLNIASITITGSSAFVFAPFYIPPTSITPAPSSNPLSISFYPTTPGLQVATVTIVSNDPDEGTYTFTIQGNGICTPPAVISTVFPTSGPTGTEVVINNSSGSFIGTTVNFNGTPAAIVSGTATQLVVIVPAGATTGNVNVVNTASGCIASSPFTIINNDLTSCDGIGNNFSDLIISEVYDSTSFNVWHMELYNPTAAAIDLDAAGANYRLERYGNIGDAVPTRTVDISGVIPPGGVYYAQLGNTGTPCGGPYNFTALGAGINELDQIRLTKENVAVDIVNCPNEVGYSIKRLPTATGPTAIFNAADWNINSNETCADLKFFTPSSRSLPIINTQPSVSLTCSSTSAVLTVTASEGFVGSNPLAYQWYVVPPNTTNWTALTNTGVYTGTTTNTLTISSLTGLNGYQYYCQVRENTATCYIATVAVKITTGITTVWNGSMWDNGAPTLTTPAIINGNYDMTSQTNIDACSVTVNSPFIVTIVANKYMNIQNELTVNAGAIVDVLSGGTLVQINNAAINTGSIVYRRTTNVRLEDYVYWSTPVNNFSVQNISSSTPTNYIWNWNPIVANSNGGQGNWETASGTMTNGRGYILRAPTGYSNSVATAYTANFSGIPNNGIFTPTIARGSDIGAGSNGPNGILRTVTDDNWNLLGNPYPSAISINAFLTANAANIDGFVRLWTHGNLPSGSALNPFYGSFVSNYTAADYIAVNGTGSTIGPGFSAVIGAGQGFFVLMNPGAATTSNVTFNNAMRDKTYYNSQFYKAVESPKQDRIWLDLVSSSSETTRTLIGYVQGATDLRDQMFDAITDYKNNQNIYSLINNDIMAIQGRSLPFKNTDIVPIGIKVPTNGMYTIAIAAVEGLFENNNQTIYLEDKLTNNIHNLSSIPYEFSINKGIENNRFILRYTDAALSNSNFVDLNNTVSVYTTENSIKINAIQDTITGYEVYDVLGRNLASSQVINNKNIDIHSVLKRNQALIIKITLKNGQTVSKKVVF